MTPYQGGILSRYLRGTVPSIDRSPRFWPTPFGSNCERLYEEANSGAARHWRLEVRWTRLHYVFGLATVTLAAAAGFGGLQDLLGTDGAAYLSLAAAVVAAVGTFLRTSDQQRLHHALAVAWDDLIDDITVTYTTAVPKLPEVRSRRATRDARLEVRPPSDPDGWEEILADLRRRVKRLRSGTVADEPRTGAELP